MIPFRRLLPFALSLLALPLAAQDPLAKDIADVNKKAATALMRFAKFAERNKVGPRAKEAYTQILDHYAVDHTQARRGLGYKKVKGEWQLPPPDKRKVWKDEANDKQRYAVVGQWYETAIKLAGLHRVLGLKMMEGDDLVRGTLQLQRAVYFNPADRDAHLALGHDEYDGFYGTEEQVVFVKRMKEIETQALQLARKEYEVEPIPDENMPEELRKMKLEFSGARSEHYTIWTRGTQENADNCAKWGERGLDFLVYMIGEEQAKRRRVRERVKGTFKWYGFVWTTQEREDFLMANPKIWKDREGGLQGAKAFANIAWQSAQGRAMLNMKLTPAQMHDRLIVLAWEMGLPGQMYNDALVQGMYHAATWYMMSTSITKHGALPKGTVGARELELPESTNWWLRAVRDQATAGEDWEMNQVPREQLSRFRNDVRLKSWNFMTWCFAAYPDSWLDFVTKAPKDKIPFPEEIDKLGDEVFGKSLAEVEAEWREWARGSSGVASATGYGPPLLPEKPSKEELEALERINSIRVLAGLENCELDAEASIACREHAHYLTLYPEEHLKWPEAHEQNPANEGYTPRGMRAGMRSVILWSSRGGVEFARDSVDGWIGTVYHRFPLLMHNIRRFGYAYEDNNGYAIGVLDMGSLEEPYDPETAPRVVIFPGHQMENVPRQFHGIEHPNPIGDFNEDPASITETGYPVSLQIQRELAGRVAEASIEIYEVKGRGKPPENFLLKSSSELKPWQDRRGDMVPSWKHTPMSPLLKRMEEKEVVFAIPRDHLKAKTSYQVEVTLTGQGLQLWAIWEFKTGSQMQGLGRL